MSRVSRCTFHTFSYSNNKLQYVHIFFLFFFYLSLNFFSGDVKFVLILFIDIYIVFISSIADDKYHGYQSLAGICCQVRSQLAGCKQPAIIALGRLPPADQVTETALMAFRSLLERFALALVSLCICSCPNNPNHSNQWKLLYSVLSSRQVCVTMTRI